MLITMTNLNPRLGVNLTALVAACLLILGLALPSSRVTLRDLVVKKPEPETSPSSPQPASTWPTLNKPAPKYKPTPTYVPPPITDNFPLLATSTPPPIPKWNQPRENVHKDYDLPLVPPLLIGFTRTWPLLLQVVVSYITAGWPAGQIYVVENTGVQQANARGQLSLQNPFYLNHTVLKTLGVNIIQTPALPPFAQMQNMFLSLSYANSWPYYFWSHMDVLALSFEDGYDGLTPRYDQPGYKSLYELALEALHEARASDPHWAVRFFAYDHLTVVNPAAYEDVGGWDTLIPYYMADCDMHSRMLMRNWSMTEVKAGIITDVAAALDDLRALYRVEGVEPAFTDPNPPPPPKPENPLENNRKKRRWQSPADRREQPGPPEALQQPPGKTNTPRRDGPEDANLARWHALRQTGDRMFQHKHSDRGRNTWQEGQRGGAGEPFYYPAVGLAEGLDVVTEAGREVYRRKWGHRDCDLISGAGLQVEDAWRVEKDWE